MFQFFPHKQPTIRNSLILRIGLLILLSLAIFAFGSYRLIVAPAIESLAEAQMGQASEQFKARLDHLLLSVEVTLRSSRDWGVNGDLDQDDLLRFNDFFFPIISQHGEISSVNFAHESGREIFLLHRRDGKWINRISNPEQWGRQTYWITWSAERQIEQVEMRELDYDTRTRPWFRSAMMQPATDTAIGWTAPYTFFTTGEPGITAAMRWTGKDGSHYVIGHDVGLTNLSEFTTRLSVGQRGVAALFAQDGKLVALPRDDQFSSSDAIRAASLKTAAQLGIGAVAQAYARWQEAGEPGAIVNTNIFSGSTWFSLFQPISIGQQKFWLGVFAPKSEFIPGRIHDLLLLALIALLSLSGGVYIALRVARRISQPLDALVHESARIGQMALDEPVIVASPWREITELAVAHEAMRQHLQAAKQTLEESNSLLEAKVAERTSELENSRAALQKREAFFRTMFEHAIVGTVSLSPDRLRQRANPAFAKFLGYVDSNSVTRSYLDFFSENERERMQQAFNQLATGALAQFRSEVCFLHEDGSTRWGDVQLAAIRDDAGNISALLLTTLDITDRRQVEQALAHQLGLMQALLDTIPNPIFYKGADTRFLGCNQAYETTFGIPRSCFVGKRVLDLDYLPEVDRESYQAEDEAVVRDCGRITREVDIPFVDGMTHHTLYSVTGFRNADGSPGGLIGLIVDFTSLKNAEQEARRARAEAEAASVAKADFLANMSHEIRTPMNAIIGMTHLALQTELSAKQKNYLGKVDAAAKGLLGIINDILDFSKIEAGKMRFEQAEFRLDDVMNHVADLSTLKARDKNLELMFNISSEVPDRLVGDSLRLGQVLTNLVGNALKFTEHGEITVDVRTVTRSDDQTMLEFAVRDTGIGLSETACKDLFSAFVQADSSTTRKYGGTGLGLSISKRIVDMMSGQIGVESQEGVGSRFFFTAQFGIAQPLSLVERPGDIPDNLRILVVDDNPSARDIFLHMLDALDFEVEAVASGEAALACLTRAQEEQRPYQLVVMDWRMPGMDGVETIRHIRSDQEAVWLPDTPAFVMTTAYDRDELLRSLGDLQVSGILIKPVTPSSLLDSIISAFGTDKAGTLQAPEKLAPAITRSLAGCRVLLVEDNDVNQELAVDLLAVVGIRADVASNGAEAVTMVRQGAYDLVLMDCQMPVMDGYTATRIIREIPQFATLPIIAMTADVLAGDIEKCRAVGMNDHVSKPIDVAMLYTTLNTWYRLAAEGAEHNPEAAPETGDFSSLRAIGVDVPGALARMDGNEVIYRRFLHNFLDRQADATKRIRAALANDDRDTASRLVHTLKALAGSLGAQMLASAAEALEIQLRQLPATAQANAASSTEMVSKVDDAQRSLIAAIVSTVATNRSRPAAAPTAADLPHAIKELSLLLHNDDARAARYVESLLPAFRGRPEEAEFEQMAKAIARYDYELALERLNDLARRISAPLN